MTADDSTLILPTVGDTMILPRIDDEDRTDETAHGALIELDDVGMTYPGPPPVEALKPVRLRVDAGEYVAIARALAAESSLLLCDEPIGNLDSATAEAVMATIDELHAQGLTTLMITHVHDVAERAERAVTIRDGQLSEGNRTTGENLT